jgi:flavin-dependent dehydrogenase
VLVVRARLVVAADGRHSDIADCAALPVQRWPNNRFTYFTYFRNLELRGGANSQYWHMGKRFAYAFANDAGTTLLGCFMPIEELPQWRGNVEHAFMRFWEQVPDAPHLRTADRCGEMRGVIKHPNQRREMTAPGLALIGDALLSVDPIWGTGCGWAIESSAWLVDAVAPALAPGAPAHDVDRAVLRYARKHRRATNAHVDHICSLSTGRSTNWAENRIFEAGVSDPIVAASVLAYFGRIQPPSSLFAPRVLARAARTLVKHSVARLSAVTEHTS